MTDTGDDLLQHLLGIFAGEAGSLFDRVEAGLAALEPAAAPARDALFQSILEALHTLKGAARAVELGDLEAVCHAYEGALAAARAGAPPDAGHYARLRRALGTARLLVARPSGRTRNQALAAICELELLAGQLAGGAAPACPSGQRIGAVH